MNDVTKLFGSNVFNEQAMKERLPKDTYKGLKETMETGSALEEGIANIVANAMKDWAIEKGATHFTHWFSPLTGTTAEKHDSFITPTDGGGVIMEFSGRELVKGEPDASSFPSGGLRSTFEARGYTSWDPSSFAFVKDNTLYVPSAFYSYMGEALDSKTPLLRSNQLVCKESLRLLHLLGMHDVNNVTTTIGVEQEYFLIDRALYERRKDLQFCQRTLFGNRPPKGQELDDHYFGIIKPKVKAFMQDLDRRLWALGIYAKTEHNEVAPSQHELAPIYTNTNLAVDHNQLTMELMRRTARDHDLVCILHEKPFAGVNGSGKHNNWSISTNTGINLLEAGKRPSENKLFLLFLAAIIRAVDDYQDLIRISVSTASNDERLGGNEAPPSIVSVFLGSDLEAVIDSIINDKDMIPPITRTLQGGVNSLPHFLQDTTDRNRTSPFAYTGNKFEFRMPGSSLTIAEPNIIINTIVAESLSHFCTYLEQNGTDEATVDKLIKETFTKHQRIIFNGNNYSAEWVKEAEKRGLSFLKTTPEALSHFLDDKNVQLFAKHRIYSAIEINSRYNILLEDYNKKRRIEAYTMLDIARKDIMPAVVRYTTDLATAIRSKKDLALDVNTRLDEGLLARISEYGEYLYLGVDRLQEAVNDAEKIPDRQEQANFYAETVTVAMQLLRDTVDELELLIASSYWPFPRYEKLLYSLD
ncbi:MAG: glutamine synthetase III [Eubacteriales bacterium]|nr:glutamine synthetase III [Eubacteriales bacterium]